MVHSRTAWSFALILALPVACRPPVPSAPCRADSECPAGWRCDQVRLHCLLSQDGGAGDGRRFDAAIDEPGTVDRAGLDRALLDHAIPSDAPTADTRPGDAAGGDAAAESGPGDGAPDDSAPGTDRVNDDGGMADADADDAGPCGGGCWIAEQCWAAGESKPGDSCFYCDPSAPGAWTLRAVGTGCDTDGNVCTGFGRCLAGGCNIELGCGDLCDPVQNRCCGDLGLPCCTELPYCSSALWLLQCRTIAGYGDLCLPTDCGGPGETCCDGYACFPFAVCVGTGTCEVCGPGREYCCSTLHCTGASVCVGANSCGDCGAVGEYCCKNRQCDHAQFNCCDNPDGTATCRMAYCEI